MAEAILWLCVGAFVGSVGGRFFGYRTAVSDVLKDIKRAEGERDRLTLDDMRQSFYDSTEDE